MAAWFSPQTLLIAALYNQTDSYGLELVERIKTMSGGRIVLGHGSVYPGLKKLKLAGVVTSYEGKRDPVRGGRVRVYYALTPKGVGIAIEHRKAAQGVWGFTSTQQDTPTEDTPSNDHTADDRGPHHDP